MTDERLITIVMGGRSTASRNAHVAELMDTGFEVERRRAQGERIQVAQTFFEQRGYGVGSAIADAAGRLRLCVNDDEDGVGARIHRCRLCRPAPPPAALPTQVTPPPRRRAQPASGAAAATAAHWFGARPPVPLRARLAMSDRLAERRAGQCRCRAVARLVAPPSPDARPGPRRRPHARRSLDSSGRRLPRGEAVAPDWLNEVSRRFRTQFTDRRTRRSERRRLVSLALHRHDRNRREAACEALAARRVTCMVIGPD
ncbi:MAG: hypothetical protein ACWGHP_10540 [Stenotrophomonas sp.]